MNRVANYLQEPLPANYLAGFEDGRRMERSEQERKWLADINRMYWVGCRDGVWLGKWGWFGAGATLASLVWVAVEVWFLFGNVTHHW